MRFLFRWRKRRSEELNEEIQGHLELAARENMESGMAPRDAQTAARHEFGSIALAEEVTRDMWGGRWFADLLQDVRYGLRMLRKSPGFTAVAVLTLALGIGANTAIFSVVNAVLLRSFPYRTPSQLVLVFWSNPAWGQDRIPLCVADFDDWKAWNHAFVQPTVFAKNLYDYTSGQEPLQIVGAGVSPGFFSTLGVQPMLGRGFLPQEEKPGGKLAVIVSQNFWAQNLHRDPQAIGRDITLDGQSYVVVGVMPSSFRFPSENVELWEPLRLKPPKRRGPYFLRGFARLRPGVSLRQARADMATVSERIREETHAQDTGGAPNVLPLRTYLVGDVQPVLLVLMAAVGFLLLIAVANLANLMLVKAVGRLREFAVRTALGASRVRLIRQLLTEGLVLTALGAVLGLLLAYDSLGLLRAVTPAGVPQMDGAHIDVGVLGFTLLVSVLSCLLFALAPAWQAFKLAPMTALKEGGGRASALGHRRFRGVLVAAEVGLALILVVGATLMARSLIRLQQVNAGFQPKNVLTAEIQMPDLRYSDSRHVDNFYQQLLVRLDELPGVESAAIASGFPPDLMDLQDTFTIQEHPTPPGQSDPLADFIFVNGDYFRTLGVPLLGGRTFTDADRQSAPLVVIINQTLARNFFPNENPVGNLLRQNRSNPWMRIVGVVADVKYDGLNAHSFPALYVPYLQHSWPGAYLAVRAKQNPLGLAASVRRTVWSLDNQLPITDMKSAEDRLDESMAAPRVRTFALGLFAILALSLASIGTYGVISYSTAQRTHEMGIRVALGAEPRDVMWLIVGQGTRLALVGIVAGIAGALVLTRFLQSMLFEVKPTDLVTFVGVTILLVLVSLAACFIPGRRAMRVDPMLALRYE
jgi:putative ABC transport system permease protein